MKLSEVRPFMDKLVSDMTECDDPGQDAFNRRALAEAFMAGVRSQGLRYQKDSTLWAACGCEPTDSPTKEGKK
jgi:hypothetical protein